MVITSRALLFNPEGELFVVKHFADQSYWALPGGKLDDGEDTITCFLREMKEELGLELQHPKLTFIVEATRINRLEFFYFCTIDNAEILLSSNGAMAYELAGRAFLHPKTTEEEIKPNFLHDYDKETIEQIEQPVYIKDI